MDEPTRDPMQSYGLDHEPISFFDGAMLLSDPRRRIAETDIDGTRVSTVFTVTDGAHGRGEVPLLYETMVFSADGEDTWCERYPTREAALAGHDRACAWVRSPEVAPAPLQRLLLG